MIQQYLTYYSLIHLICSLTALKRSAPIAQQRVLEPRHPLGTLILSPVGGRLALDLCASATGRRRTEGNEDSKPKAVAVWRYQVYQVKTLLYIIHILYCIIQNTCLHLETHAPKPCVRFLVHQFLFACAKI